MLNDDYFQNSMLSLVNELSENMHKGLLKNLECGGNTLSFFIYNEGIDIETQKRKIEALLHYFQTKTKSNITVTMEPFTDFAYYQDALKLIFIFDKNTGFII